MTIRAATPTLKVLDLESHAALGLGQGLVALTHGVGELDLQIVDRCRQLLAPLARGLGKGIREFNEAKDGIKTEIENGGKEKDKIQSSNTSSN